MAFEGNPEAGILISFASFDGGELRFVNTNDDVIPAAPRLRKGGAAEVAHLRQYLGIASTLSKKPEKEYRR